MNVSSKLRDIDEGELFQQRELTELTCRRVMNASNPYFLDAHIKRKVRCPISGQLALTRAHCVGRDRLRYEMLMLAVT